MAKTELTCMVMVYDREKNRVLVQERVKSWKGIAFPGGHVECGEGLVAAAIQEVHEETGLTVSRLKPCGVIHSVHKTTGDRYFVFNFKTETFSGELSGGCDEGRAFWVDVAELPQLMLAEGFDERLPMFFEDRYAEGFRIWNERGHSEIGWL